MKQKTPKIKPGLYLNEDNGQTFILDYYGDYGQYLRVIFPDFFNPTEVYADETALCIDSLLKNGKITYIGVL